MTEREYLLTHRAHDAEGLLSRWAEVAGALGWRREVLGTSGGFEVPGYRTETEPRLYLSAGVHGDEAAGCWALLEWVEAGMEGLGDWPVAVVPCFNPWGLRENRRLTAEGTDLNRQFHRGTQHPLVKAWHAWIGAWELEVAVCLHEDYDGRGIYLYELAEPGWTMGAGWLERCEGLIPREPDGEIDGRPMDAPGLIQKEGAVDDLVAEMANELPEAVYLRESGVKLSLTFETPSEYSLYARVSCQMAFLDAVASSTRDGGRII